MFNLISCASFSIAKNFQKQNQDSILLPININDGYLFAVADGVGSYDGAKEASNLAIDYLATVSNKFENISSRILDISSIFHSIKKEISILSNTARFEEAATTLTFCYIDRYGMRIGHIGDSRLYFKKDNHLIQITKDHTRHQQLLDAKLYTPKQLKKLTGKNVLTTALSKNIEMKYEDSYISLDEISFYKDENNTIIINIMTDGAHDIWEKRPKFSPATLNSPLAFSSSLLRRIERIGASDDHTLVSVKIQL